MPMTFDATLKDMGRESPRGGGTGRREPLVAIAPDIFEKTFYFAYIRGDLKDSHNARNQDHNDRDGDETADPSL